MNGGLSPGAETSALGKAQILIPEPAFSGQTDDRRNIDPRRSQEEISKPALTG